MPTALHGVRAIEGVRIRGGRHILQRISRSDFVLMNAKPLARREPLPPTVRKRDYVWEIVAKRGITSLSVNWWTTADEKEGALTSIGQESIFGNAHGDALRVDALATSRFLAELDRTHPRFATVYLPALDVILNRAYIEQTTKLAQSIRALDNLQSLVATLRARGYDVIVAGLPGDYQLGQAVIASNVAVPQRTWDVAPAILSILGFPLAAEMPGGTTREPRITTYGNRGATHAAQTMNQDYYENLKSLGYIR